MQNVYDSLGVPADTACKDSSRKYTSAKGEYWYSEGEKLFEISDLIPSTTKDKERRVMLSSTGIGNADGVKRFLLEEGARGNRSNTILKYAMFLKDESYDYRTAKDKTIEFNDSLPDPLSKKEMEQTILKSLERKYNES